MNKREIDKREIMLAIATGGISLIAMPRRKATRQIYDLKDEINRLHDELRSYDRDLARVREENLDLRRRLNAPPRYRAPL